MISTKSVSKISRGTAKYLNNINNSIKDGKYYEAHQMLHSVSQRYIKQRKINDAIHLLHNGAKSFLNYDQEGSATDLLKRLIDLYNHENVIATEESVGRVIEIIESYKCIDQFTEDAIKMAVNWTIKNGKYQFGDENLHHSCGLKYFKEKRYYEAEHHFIFGNLDSSKALGLLDYQWSNEGYTGNYGYFIARSVLQYLALKKLSHARNCLTSFCEKIKTNNANYIAHNTNNVDIYTSSLLNFCQLLILVIERENSIEHYQKLCEKYKPVLVETDPFLGDLLDRISEYFFNIKVEKPHNMFEDLINSIFAPDTSASNKTIKPAEDSNYDID